MPPASQWGAQQGTTAQNRARGSAGLLFGAHVATSAGELTSTLTAITSFFWARWNKSIAKIRIQERVCLAGQKGKFMGFPEKQLRWHHVDSPCGFNHVTYMPILFIFFWSSCSCFTEFSFFPFLIQKFIYLFIYLLEGAVNKMMRTKTPGAQTTCMQIKGDTTELIFKAMPCFSSIKESCTQQPQWQRKPIFPDTTETFCNSSSVRGLYCSLPGVNTALADSRSTSVPCLCFFLWFQSSNEGHCWETSTKSLLGFRSFILHGERQETKGAQLREQGGDGRTGLPVAVFFQLLQLTF